jgi:glycosyltransferase involved in cell wall biosynthesis
MNLKISVIIPNYNHGRYLKQRIDSVLNQTFNSLECIILDDSSSDNSKQIIEQYRNHPKVSQIIYNAQNSGSPFKQWQRGIKLAKNDFIWIAESDDWAEPEFLMEAFSRFQEDKELGLVYCNSNMFVDGILTTTLSDVKTGILKNNKWESDYSNDGKSEIADTLSLFCAINNASAVLFKREVLSEASPFDLELKYLGDWYCYLKVASISRISYINKVLNNYRDHSSNVSKVATVNFNHLAEYFYIYDWIFRNTTVKKEKEVLSYFYGFTKHRISILDRVLLRHYLSLYKINRSLFFNMIKFNIRLPIISLLKETKNLLSRK